MRIGTVCQSKIKRIRSNKTLTMRELAERVNLSESLTSQIFYNFAYHCPSYTPFYRRGKSDKLDKKSILRIFRAKGKKTQKEVAAQEGVTQAYVSMIQSGKYYSSITQA